MGDADARVQVRGVLPQLVGGRRSGDGRRRPADASARRDIPTGPTLDSAPPRKKATKAFYPDDPSNVYHSYIDDHVKFRILHAGAGVAHVHHLHAHQWLHTPNSDDSSYLDSQMIMPGRAYTLEMAYNGSGNRNQTVGDSIFHCHFYPHFAAGHVVAVAGPRRVRSRARSSTTKDGRLPRAGTRAPAGRRDRSAARRSPPLVPMPTLAMAPMPARVRLVDEPQTTPAAVGQGAGRGLAGPPRHVEPIRGRAAASTPSTQPRLPVLRPRRRRPPRAASAAWISPGTKAATARRRWTDGTKYLDGGLPRHQSLDGKIVRRAAHALGLHARTSTPTARRQQGADRRTVIAGAFVAFDCRRTGPPSSRRRCTRTPRRHASRPPLPERRPGQLHAQRPAAGARRAVSPTRRSTTTAIADQSTQALQGGRHPDRRRLQQEGLALPAAAHDHAVGGRQHDDQRRQARRPSRSSSAPTPATASSTGTPIWCPTYYELDDFQVRTPTDIIGQHIHLVKFDVTSLGRRRQRLQLRGRHLQPRRGAGADRAINRIGGLFKFDPVKQFASTIDSSGWR